MGCGASAGTASPVPGRWRGGPDPDPRKPRPTGAHAAQPARTPRSAPLEGSAATQTALSALDRLEVRGRDSAGLHVLVTGHGLELDEPTIARLVAQRSPDPLVHARARPPRH